MCRKLPEASWGNVAPMPEFLLSSLSQGLEGTQQFCIYKFNILFLNQEKLQAL